MPSSARQPRLRSPRFQKKVLGPLWTIHIIILFLFGCVHSYWATHIGFLGSPILFICIAIANFILDVVEVAFFWKMRLNPGMFLGMQVTRFVSWLALMLVLLLCSFSLYDVDAVERMGEVEVGSFSLVVVASTAYLASLIYASMIYHRHRRLHAHLNSTLALPASETSHYDDKYPVNDGNDSRSGTPIPFPTKSILSPARPSTPAPAATKLPNYSRPATPASRSLSPALNESASSVVNIISCPKLPMQELGDETWVGEMGHKSVTMKRGGPEMGTIRVQKDVSIDVEEVFELSATKTPKTRSWRSSVGRTAMGRR